MSQASSDTIAYYDHSAPAFVERTVDVSMADALAAFVALLPAGGGVLDWGCGSGRDSRALRGMGFDVTSVDASEVMAKEALCATGTTVRVETFDKLAEHDAYDGIWACASLLHVPPQELPDIFSKAHAALKEQGTLYCSFKHGSFAGIRNGRWFTDLEEEALAALLAPLFSVERMWVSGDVRQERGGELWLNCLATKR